MDIRLNANTYEMLDEILEAGYRVSIALYPYISFEQVGDIVEKSKQDSVLITLRHNDDMEIEEQEHISDRDKGFTTEQTRNIIGNVICTWYFNIFPDKEIPLNDDDDEDFKYEEWRDTKREQDQKVYNMYQTRG